MKTRPGCGRKIPADKVVVGESGIRTADDVRQMAEMGCDAILVGETFCKLPQNQRGAKVRDFVEAGEREVSPETGRRRID